MNLVKVAAAALNQTPLDWEGNYKNILAAIAAAKEEGVNVLCLPELCITGYGCEDAFFSPHTLRKSSEVLFDIQHYGKLVSNIAVCVGLPVAYNGSIFNGVAVIADGEVLGIVAKRALARSGVHYESRWFKPWEVGKVSGYDDDFQSCPIGDMIFDFCGVNIGFEICEEAWVAERPGRSLASSGVDIILNPSASHFAFGKCEVRRRFVLDGSRAFCSGYIYSNLMGNEAGRIIYDGGCMVAANGEMLAEGPRFSFEDVQITTATIDIEALRCQRAQLSSSSTEARSSANTIRSGLKLSSKPEVSVYVHPDKQLETKEEEFTRAVSLGLFDYLRKSGNKGFTLSLSGGVDSASVACLVHFMELLGCKELGEERFWEKLGLPHVPGEERLEPVLTCVYQDSENSSERTFEAAKMLTDAIDCKFVRFNISEIVASYTSMFEGVFERKLTWEADDITLQNIQARARAPGVWMVANATNSILLTTGNRSEIAVGYTTMDGDTCGGLNPIGGIDKAFLRKWLKWVGAVGPKGFNLITRLHYVNSQEPTAELRPQDQNQTDESDLMPYDILESIETLAIRDKASPLDVWKLLCPKHPEWDGNQLHIWVIRFFQLWSRNQWKRERYAPSFHLDDKNLDPKTWCRFPILSGSFKEEIKVLVKYIEREAEDA